MSAAHTPGPWEIVGLWSKPLPDSHIVVVSPHGMKISTSAINHPDDLGEILANARLIAAAPDLLALALAQEELAGLRFEGEPEAAIARVREMRRAAISKAMATP